MTLLTNGPAELTDEDRRRLVAADVVLDERRVVAARGPDDELSSILFADGTERPCGGLLVAAVLHQRSDLATQLGPPVRATDSNRADAIDVNPTGETNVPGVLVAGDAAVGMPSVANAIAQGSNAAAAAVRSLLTEDHAPALNR